MTKKHEKILKRADGSRVKILIETQTYTEGRGVMPPKQRGHSPERKLTWKEFLERRSGEVTKKHRK